MAGACKEYTLSFCFQLRAVNPFWIDAISQWLCIFNSGCNPLVYGLTNKTFRDGVKKMFGFLRRNNKVAALSVGPTVLARSQQPTDN